MGAFSSKVRHQFDDKFRFRIPAKYRTELGNDFIFVVGDGKCIAIYPRAAFDKHVDYMVENAGGEPETMMAIRYILGTVEDDIKEDSQGRITFSAEFRDFMKFTRDERDIVTMGVQDHLEIWKASDYDKAFKNYFENTASPYRTAGYYKKPATPPQQ